MAYRLAVTAQLDALTPAKGNGTIWKPKSRIDLDQVQVRDSARIVNKVRG